MLAGMKESVIWLFNSEKVKIEKIWGSITALLDRWNNTVGLICAIILKLTIDFYFVKVISYRYQYDWYAVKPNAGKYILAWLIFTLLWKVMPKEERSVKALFLHVQFIFVLLPMLTIYAFTSEQSTKYMLLVTVAVLIESFILNGKSKTKYRPVKIDGLRSFVSVWFIFFIPLMAILIWLYGDFWGLEAWDFVKLYEIRKAARYPVILSYMNSQLTTAIVPFYVVYSLERHQYILTGILLIIDIFLYMILAYKGIYLLLVVVIGVYILAKSRHLLKFLYMGLTGGLILLAAMSFFERKQMSSITSFGAALVGNRFLFVPAASKFWFYDFFQKFPKVHFADGTLGKLLGLTNLYKYSSGEMVYAFIVGDKLGNANFNTGYLGDAYAEAGTMGVLLFAVLLASIVSWISNYEGKIPFVILAPMIVLYVIVLSDVTLTTVLLTSGLLVFIIFLAVYAGESEEEGKR